MRAEANSLIGIDNLKCQLVPFTFPVKHGRHTVKIKNVPMCYTPHLWEKIQHILNSNDDDERRYNLINQLRDCANILFFLECTGLLGMKGRYLLTRSGSSSGSSWVEISILIPLLISEAPDNVTNLKIALQRFEDEVDSLQSKTWRY